MSEYGPITMDDWRRYWRNGQYLHVFLDGVEVTTNCFFADDVAGLIEVYERDDHGHVTQDPDTHKPRTTSKHGRVEIVPSFLRGSSSGEVF